MHGQDGAVRPHWQGPGPRAARLRPRGDVAALGAGAALIRQHGVSFNVYGDARGLERPWPLDPVPVVLAPDEFASARRGLAQRAHAARPAARRPLRPAAGDARRACCRRRWCSAHPGLLRAVRRDRRRPGGRFLHFYAADLVRTPEGELRVLADRTQAPAGAGYALENRIVLGARVARGVPRVPRAAAGALLPHAARHAGRAGAARPREPAHRAAHRRAAQRDVLRAGVPGPVPRLPAGRGRRSDRARRARVPEDAGRPAPGRRHPAPPERRLLRSARAAAESLLGVPGLVQAARDGNVAIANALGSGHRADAGVHAVPAVAVPRAAGRGADARVGRDLVVRAARDPRARAGQLRRHGHQAGLSGTAPAQSDDPTFGASWTSGASRSWSRRCARRPARYVAQRRVLPSTVAGDRRRRAAPAVAGAAHVRRRRRRRRLPDHAGRAGGRGRAPPTRSTSRSRAARAARTPG